MKLNFLLGCILTIASAQILVAQTVPMTAPTSDNSGYLVGIGDQITAKVIGEPQFDFVAQVDTDGTVQVPFFDQTIDAKCRTEKQLHDDVSDLLKKYLKSPQVSLQVTQRNSRPPVIVTGEVRSQQKVDLSRQARLLDLISQAGGVTEDANGVIQVFRTQQTMCSENAADVDWRNDSVNVRNVPSRVYSLKGLNQGYDESNPIILPGDVIVVKKASPVYITGEVNAPQGILLKEGGTSLMDALAKVNGPNRQAKTKDIKIYRVKPNSSPQDNREVLSVNYEAIKKGEQQDVLLEPYDIIEVGKAKDSVAKLILKTAAGVGTTAATTFGGGLSSRILY